ncbi:MAG: hypothetical protein HY301_07695 [Verrucomicrobia bacterium]|nr:hypothetical protein [Verrucomicrobiota bacterium]
MKTDLLARETSAPARWPGRAVNQPSLAGATTPPRATQPPAELVGEELTGWLADFLSGNDPCEPHTGDC